LVFSCILCAEQSRSYLKYEVAKHYNLYICYYITENYCFVQTCKLR